jgi:cytochrome c peroxidase
MFFLSPFNDRFRALGPRFVAVALGALVSLSACADSDTPHGAVETPDAVERASVGDEPILPLPPPAPLSSSEATRVALGQRLFVDPILSGDGKVTCGACHLAENGGADGRKMPWAREKASGVLNVPSIYNLAYSDAFNWGGRYRTLEEQIDAPIVGPLLMATTWPDIVKRLRANGEYVSLFTQAYPDGITVSNVRNSLVAYERALATPNSRFDRFLRGDSAAVSDDEREGYALFKVNGCAACHQGANVGGNMFAKFGVMRDYFADRGNVTEADMGRFLATGDEADRFVFRVPSLRNIELTAPYFHDGSVETLEQAVRVMSVYQLGRALSADDINKIVAFLRTLTAQPVVSLP